MSRYLIDAAPINVETIDLHLGHLFSHVRADFSVRYQATINGAAVIHPHGFDVNAPETRDLLSHRGKDKADYIVDTCERYTKSLDKFFITPYRSYTTGNLLATELCHQSFHHLLWQGALRREKVTYYECPALDCWLLPGELDGQGQYNGFRVRSYSGVGWYVDVQSKVSEIGKLIHDIVWEPPLWGKMVYSNLKKNMGDWLITRPGSYGIPVPGEDGLVFNGNFITSLTPQLAWSSYCSCPELNPPVFDLAYRQLSTTASLFWVNVLYIIIKSYYHGNKIPWNRLVVIGPVKTEDGELPGTNDFRNPTWLLERYGANAFRFWAAHAKNGKKIDFETTGKDSIYAIMEDGKRLALDIQTTASRVRERDKIGSRADFFTQWDRRKLELKLLMKDCEWKTALGQLLLFYESQYKVWLNDTACSPNYTLNDIFSEMMDYWRIFMPSLA